MTFIQFLIVWFSCGLVGDTILTIDCKHRYKINPEYYSMSDLAFGDDTTPYGYFKMALIGILLGPITLMLSIKVFFS